jgi:putative heme transporter
VDEAQFPATAGSERPGAARRPGITKARRARVGTVVPVTVVPVTVVPVTVVPVTVVPVPVAPVTGSAPGGVLAGGAPDEADPPCQKVASRWRRLGRLGLTAVAAAAVVVLLGRERDLIASSLRVAAHLEWAWFVLAVALESLSLASFARMQCRLLRAGARRVRPLPVMATAYAGNALSATLPLVGPQMSTVFVFRRFKQLGVDASVAGWALVVAGVVSSLASALLSVVGAILSGNDVVAATGAAGGAVGLGFFALATAAIRRPAVLGVVHRPAAWVLRQAWRVLGRPALDPDAVLGDLLTRLGSLRLPPSGWLTVTLLAFLNWLADAGVLAASVAAAGAPVPWRDLLFVYAVGTAVASAGIVPGGLGVVEGALALTLMGAGLRHPVALAAVLIYRFISFWMVISVGWLIYFLGPRTGHTGGSRRAAPRHPGLTGPLGDVELRVPRLVDLQSGSVSGPARERRQERTV